MTEPTPTTPETLVTEDAAPPTATPAAHPADVEPDPTNHANPDAEHDTTTPAESAEELAAYFRSQGANVTLHWHEGGHEIRRDELLAIRDFLD